MPFNIHVFQCATKGRERVFGREGGGLVGRGDGGKGEGEEGFPSLTMTVPPRQKLVPWFKHPRAHAIYSLLSLCVEKRLVEGLPRTIIANRMVFPTSECQGLDRHALWWFSALDSQTRA